MKYDNYLNYLIIAALFFATVFVYLVGKDNGSASYANANKTLLSIELLNSSLNQFALSRRYRLESQHEDLDGYRQALQEIKNIYSNEKDKEKVFWRRDAGEDLNKVFSEFENKISIVKDFKQDVATLKYSQEKFPLILSNMKFLSLVSINDEMLNYEREGLNFILNKESDFIDLFNRLIANEKYENIRNHSEWELLFRHTANMIDIKIRIDSSINIITSSKIPDLIDEEIQLINTNNSINNQEANAYQLMLFIATLALILFCGYKIYQIQKISNQLSESSIQLQENNHKLEARVEKRSTQLIEAEKRTRLILEMLDESVIAINTNNCVSYANHRAASSLGYDSDEFIDVNVNNLVFKKEMENEGCFRDSISRHRGSYNKEDSLKVKNGEELLVEFNYKPMLDAENSLKAVITFRDIRDKKAAENEMDKLNQELKMAQKLEAIGQMASGIAHEINTPTQYVGDHIDFLKTAYDDLKDVIDLYAESFEKVPVTNEKNEALELIEELKEDIDMEFLNEEIPTAFDNCQEGVKQISKIVKAMKGFGHPGNDVKEAVDINLALENTITVCKNEWKYVAELKTDFEEGLPMLNCFPGELNQVFLNMIVNAAHAIEGKIKNTDATKGVITVHTKYKEDYIHVDIQDDGTGIPEKSRDKIFDPFYTTKGIGKGTGQGLAISHSIVVEKHAGKLDFTTENDVGTTFHIRLPLEVPQAVGVNV